MNSTSTQLTTTASPLLFQASKSRNQELPKIIVFPSQEETPHESNSAPRTPPSLFNPARIREAAEEAKERAGSLPNKLSLFSHRKKNEDE